MPKPLLFVPCETYHVDTATNQHSLGKILQDVVLGEGPYPGGHEEPLPKFYAVALFENSDEDHGKPFLVKLQLKFPDGRVVKLSEELFTPHKTFQWYHTTQADKPDMPLYQNLSSGDYHLRMWVHKGTEPQQDNPAATFPFTIRVKQAPVSHD